MINKRFPSLDTFQITLLAVSVSLLVLFSWAFWTKGPEPIAALSPTPTTPSTATHTHTPSLTPTRSISTPTLTPTQTHTTPESPESATPTETSTAIAILAPTPTPVSGEVDVENLAVRSGPGIDYEYVRVIREGERIIILGCNRVRSWLKIETSNGIIGWVNGRFIKKSIAMASLPILPAPSPPPASAPVTQLPDLDFSQEIDIEGRSVFGKLAPYEDDWYTFTDEDLETIITLLFEPNVNSERDHFVRFNVAFFLHDEDKIPIWPPGDADSVVHIGAGSPPAHDRDGDWGTGELVWRGGPLIPGQRYYLRLVNRTPNTIEYCLAPADVFEWVCLER
jgi:hypothetical protein